MSIQSPSNETPEGFIVPDCLLCKAENGKRLDFLTDGNGRQEVIFITPVGDLLTDNDIQAGVKLAIYFTRGSRGKTIQLYIEDGEKRRYGIEWNATDDEEYYLGYILFDLAIRGGSQIYEGEDPYTLRLDPKTFWDD